MAMKTAITGNPSIGRLLRTVLWVVFPVLVIAGGGLFFQPAATRPLWPWDIGPFNARFFGGFYLASALGILVAAVGGRWFPARVVTPMMFVFSATVLLVSLVSLPRFVFTNWTTYAWFVIFIGLALSSAVSLVRYRAWPAPVADATPAVWGVVLMGLALLFLVYGSGLFLFPAVVAAHWPWVIDAMHARIYSAIFTATAVAMLGLAQWAAPSERLAVGLATAGLGVLAIFSVVITNARTQTVDWGRVGVWVWLALFGLYLLIGLVLIWWSTSRRAAGAQPE